MKDVVPGTILKDGACVLDSSSKSSGTSVKGIGKELIVGVAAAFVIAGIIGIILGLMSKVSKNRDNHKTSLQHSLFYKIQILKSEL